MISVMSNATLEFSNGDETVVASVGFNRLPDWVGQTEYFKLCSSGITPLITQFEGTSECTMGKR